MLPRNRVYGRSDQGTMARARVFSRTYGLVAVASDEQQGQSGGEKKHVVQVAGQWASGREDRLSAGQRLQQQYSRHSNRAAACLSRAVASISRAAARGSGQTVGRVRKRKQRLYSM